MPRRRRVALAVSALVAASCSFAATAHAMSAPAYRLRLNGICRSYTPKLRKLEADAAAAKQAGDVHQIFFDLGYGVALGLREDQAIEAVAVPAALQTQMAPIIRLFKTVDAHARTFLRDAQANNANAALAEMKKIEATSAPANRMLDHAGLLDCGSRQS